MGKKYLKNGSDIARKTLSYLQKQNPQAVIKGKYLQKITCPSCGKKEAFTYVENPWAIICPRKKKCGVKTNVLVVAPGLCTEEDINDWCKDGAKF
jgi:hypothetical protein